MLEGRERTGAVVVEFLVVAVVEAEDVAGACCARAGVLPRIPLSVSGVSSLVVFALSDATKA